MSRFLGPLIILGCIIGVFVVTYQRLGGQIDSARQSADLWEVRADFLARSGWVAAIPEGETYVREANALFATYLEDLGALQKEHGSASPGAEPGAAYEEDLRRREEAGASAEDLSRRRERFAMVQEVYELVRDGRYRPEWSGTAKGLRLDVVRTDIVQSEGRPVIRFLLVLWGAPRELREVGTQRMLRMEADASMKAEWRFYGGGRNPQLLGRMEAPGDPFPRIDWPEHYIETFPPNLVIGRYEIDLALPNAERTEIVFTVRSKAPSGEPIEAELTWRLKTPYRWKLQEGEGWENAQEELLPSE